MVTVWILEWFQINLLAHSVLSASSGNFYLFKIQVWDEMKNSKPNESIPESNWSFLFLSGKESNP